MSRRRRKQAGRSGRGAPAAHTTHPVSTRGLQRQRTDTSSAGPVTAGEDQKQRVIADIRFHLPDFVRHFRLNVLLCEMLKHKPQYFREGIRIGSVYGTFPTSLWNGGRSFSGTLDRQVAYAIMRAFNDRGIPLRFTFSNPRLTQDHLQDPFCNQVPEMADNGLNEVIVVSPLLEEYIREKYPRYRITSSTCKCIRDLDGLAGELAADYSLVVLDYNMNNQYDLLRKVPHKEKCELLVNACCIPACPKRRQHYEHIGDYQIKLTEHMKHPNEPFTDKAFECPQMDLNLYQTTHYSTHIRPDDIYDKYVPMGFRHFKID
jgi:hypothetical protein